MEIKLFEHNGCFAYLNCMNGKIVYADRAIDLAKLKTYRSFDSAFTSPRFLSKYSVFYLGFDLSGKCNLSCEYCFRKKPNEKAVDVDFVEKTIKKYIACNPNCKRLFVDLSGSSESLLVLKHILTVADICSKIKEESGIDIVVNFICNGTLLTKDVVKQLQSHNILFGVSIDGLNKSGNTFRHYQNGKDSFDDVIENIKGIEDRHLFGVSMTLNNQFDGDIYESYMLLSKLAPTFSIRLCRNNNLDYNDNSLAEIKRGYLKISKFISENVNAGNFEFVSGLINGDDHFSKIFVRVILGAAVSYPCEGLIGRFFCTKEKLYPCAPASEEGVFEVNSFFESNKQFNACSYSEVMCAGCFARRFCGGECPIVLKKQGMRDAFNCELRKYFIELSISIIIDVMDKKDNYEKLLKIAWERAKRNMI